MTGNTWSGFATSVLKTSITFPTTWTKHWKRFWMDDLLGEALIFQFRTLWNKAGWEILRGSDADQLALLALAGDETVGGLDQTYANIIVSHPQIRARIETIRVRNTKPLK